MSKKNIHTAPEPSWAEVILGAVLSVVLGVALGVVLLAIKPLVAVKELPKEPVAGTIYYVQGSRDSAKARQAAAKRKMFAQGGTVTVTEDEINSFLAAPPPLAPPPGTKPAAAPAPKAPEKAKTAEKAKAGDKGAPAGPASSGELLTVAAPNFRIHDGAVQIAVPATVSLLGLSQEVTMLATGTFVKKGDAFAFEPATLFLGSCPVQRLPFAAGFVTKKFLNSQPVPDDIAAAWPKLADVTVDGSTLKLAMP